MDFVQLVSFIAVTLTVCMFMAGIPACVAILRHRSVGIIPFLPFITTQVNCLVWFSYGVTTSNWSIMICNTIGGVLQVAYIIIYIIFAKPKSKPIQQTLTALVLLLTTYIYLTRYVQDAESIIRQLGLLGASITMLMYIAPLSELAEIIKSRNAGSISSALTLAQLSASSSWFIYGLLISDVYIYFPNMPGIISCLLRVYLSHQYGSGASSTGKAR